MLKRICGAARTVNAGVMYSSSSSTCSSGNSSDVKADAQSKGDSDSAVQ
jgi:hypothetical protein